MWQTPLLGSCLSCVWCETTGKKESKQVADYALQDTSVIRPNGAAEHNVKTKDREEKDWARMSNGGGEGQEKERGRKTPDTNTMWIKYKN